MFLTINSLKALEVIFPNDMIAVLSSTEKVIFCGLVKDLECKPDQNLCAPHIIRLTAYNCDGATMLAVVLNT